MTSTPWEATARVLKRASFGATGTDIDAAHAQGITTWVAATVSSETFAAAAAEARHTAPDVPMPAPRDHSATREAKRAANAAQRKAAEQVIAWWVERIWTTTKPVVEKITFGWHEHWATSVKKVKAGRLMLAQNLTLREHGTGSFTTMATALTRDPALLHWLDAQKNTAKAPNENLARELMELFTLGQGHGYTETDVKEAARALTGWRIADDGTATFDAKRHDQGTKTVLGVTGNLGVEEVLAAILARLEHPIHLATRWWHRLASPTDPGADTLGRLLAAYGSGRDNGALLRAILTDPAMLFWLDGQRNTRRAPNENLAREFMELFTLGVDGGYTEADVREGARALTGWTVKPDGSEFVAARHDPSAKTILGRTGAFDAQGFADVVLAQASGPAYVVSRWWHQLAAPTAPTPETLARLLEGYGPAGDATGMIRAILTDPAFAGAAGTMVLSPVEWAIGAIRALGVTLDDQRVPLLLAGLRRLGQVPLLPPDVAG
ncbi:MAG TPA: DUF1800 family protein, partial [Phycicoccus sp.]|nr:DUF1800 family protein [Phycicoccus sp.]